MLTGFRHSLQISTPKDEDASYFKIIAKEKGFKQHRFSLNFFFKSSILKTKRTEWTVFQVSKSCHFKPVQGFDSDSSDGLRQPANGMLWGKTTHVFSGKTLSICCTYHDFSDSWLSSSFAGHTFPHTNLSSLMRKRRGFFSDFCRVFAIHVPLSCAFFF